MLNFLFDNFLLLPNFIFLFLPISPLLPTKVGSWSGSPFLRHAFFPSRHLVSCLPDFSDEQRIAFKVGIMPVQQHNGKPIFHHSTFDAVIVAF